MRRMLRALLITGLCLCSVGPGLAQEAPTIVVLFDGSGSMWGKPDGEAKTKLALARDALKLGLAKAAPEARIGLMSYGHRRGGDCGDIESIVKPDKGTAERINTVLEKHNPRGRGPLTNALKEAAKELGPQSAPASVILIHDDPDNCQLDPCTALGDLRRAHPKVVVHVVSVAMKREDAQRMACLTRPTGGTLSEVATGSQANAALETIMRQASVGRGGEAPGADAGGQPKGPAAAVAPAGPARPGLQLTAKLAAGGEPIQAPIRWRVTPVGQTNAVPVYEADAVAPLLQLPTGRYEIQAQYGFVLVRATVDVAAGAARTLEVPLGAGTVKLASAAPAAGMLRDAIVMFQRTDAPAGSTAEQPAILRGIQPEVALAPGAYAVSVTAGSLRIERRMTIAAGARAAFEPQLNFGEVDLVAVAAPGGPPLDPVVFAIFEDDPDQPQGRREVARTAASRPHLALPAGTYYATVRHGATEARDRFAVRAGDREQRILALNASRVAISFRLPGRAETREAVSIRLERADEPKEVVQSSRASAQFDVAAGRYRLDARIGSGNVRVERDLDLKPGAREQIVLEPLAGGLVMRLLDQAGGVPLPDVAWEVRDRTGKVVWAASQTEARPLLMQGRYQIKVEARNRRAVRDVDVRAGEMRPLDIVGQ